MTNVWKRITLFALTFLLFLNVRAQSDTAAAAVYSVSAYLDLFYAWDFGRPRTPYRQPFLYNHNRHNEISLNLGYVKASVQQSKYRGNIALMGGTYSSDNYASEPRLLRHVFEANVGFSLNRNRSLWLDAGIFGSHIGFESAVSAENMTLTRSLLAENSPYYLAGAKLNWKAGKRAEASVLLLNGWQRITPVAGNTLPSAGTQLKYAFRAIALNWSTFAGTDDPDSTRRMRYFSNLFVQSDFAGRFNFIAGFDIGIQQSFRQAKSYSKWFSPVMIVRYELSEQWKLAFRGEYYSDRDAVIIRAYPKGFHCAGVSANLDYKASATVLFRLEARAFSNREPVFTENGRPSFYNRFAVFSAAISL